MGCAPSSPESRVNDNINAAIRREKTKRDKETRLLLLGPGESGKSTIFKQMKILQIDGGFSQEEMAGYRTLVFRNCISEMKALAAAAVKLEMPMSTPQLNQYATWFLEQVPMDGSIWTKDVGSVIRVLWNDEGMKKVFALRGIKYHLNDTAPYFFDNVDRFMEPNYLPSEADILRTRIRSTGIEEAEFKFADITFRMMDVGGQRSERRKWIHCFESEITAIVFCASLSCYDQLIREDDQTNAMNETLLLFDEVSNNQFFKKTAMILLLNKKDLFEEKIKRVDLNVWHKGYTGGLDYDKAVDFIKTRFVERAPEASRAHMFTHVTVAVDSKNVDLIFKAVRQTLLELATKEFIM